MILWRDLSWNRRIEQHSGVWSSASNTSSRLRNRAPIVVALDVRGLRLTASCASNTACSDCMPFTLTDGRLHSSNNALPLYCPRGTARHCIAHAQLHNNQLPMQFSSPFFHRQCLATCASHFLPWSVTVVWWRNAEVSDSRSRGRGFDSRSGWVAI